MIKKKEKWVEKTTRQLKYVTTKTATTTTTMFDNALNTVFPLDDIFIYRCRLKGTI